MDGLRSREALYDAVIIGGGPAGLTAALYLARARYRVLVLEKERFGGQITITSQVVNYPGVECASGAELTDTMRRQAQSFGAEFLLAEAEELKKEGELWTVGTSRGVFSCFSVLVAAGAHPRQVGFEGEEEFRGRGVAYCATCDGEFFTGKDVFVIGGGFAAAEEGVFLTKYARQVTILIRGEDFSCAKSAADAARNHPKIRVLTNARVEAVSGEAGLTYIRWRNRLTGEAVEFRSSPEETFGVFVFAGYEPASGILSGIAQLDSRGYVLTDRNQKTSVEGVYAAGDICAKELRQVVTAVGDGALAATQMEKYAAAMQQKTGLYPVKPQGVPAPGNKEASVPGAAGSTSHGANASDSPAAGGGIPGGAAAGLSQGSEGIFTPDMIAQLNTVFSRMENPLALSLSLDGRPISRELREYMDTLANLTDKLTLRVEEGSGREGCPCVRICRADGTYTGLAFHGVPGGHEFTSFILGLYNASGPGQPLEEELLGRIKALRGPFAITLMVSLSCTMCPELVTAAQKLASVHPGITAEVYDLNHFPELKERYQVMSVPCMVINQGRPLFGKKNIRQLVELLEGAGQ